LKIGHFQNDFKKTLRGHIDFISEIELSKCVEAVWKIWKLLRIFFLIYRPLSESVLKKYIEVMFKKPYEDGFQSLQNYKK
jgi:hypothetical protein